MTSVDVYNSLKHDILYLNLRPGDMISELEICKQYGISRTPARDAIKALVAEGLLEVRPHVGTFISLIDLSKVSDSVFIREVLEQAVLKELCPNFNSYDALNLEASCHSSPLWLTAKGHRKHPGILYSWTTNITRSYLRLRVRPVSGIPSAQPTSTITASEPY